MRKPVRFWNPMPPGAYQDLFWTLWIIMIMLCLLTLAVAGIDALHLGFAGFDPRSTPGPT